MKCERPASKVWSMTWKKLRVSKNWTLSHRLSTPNSLNHTDPKRYWFSHLNRNILKKALNKRENHRIQKIAKLKMRPQITNKVNIWAIRAKNRLRKKNQPNLSKKEEGLQKRLWLMESKPKRRSWNLNPRNQSQVHTSFSWAKLSKSSDKPTLESHGQAKTEPLPKENGKTWNPKPRHCTRKSFWRWPATKPTSCQWANPNENSRSPSLQCTSPARKSPTESNPQARNSTSSKSKTDPSLSMLI